MIPSLTTAAFSALKYDTREEALTVYGVEDGKMEETALYASAASASPLPAQVLVLYTISCASVHWNRRGRVNSAFSQLFPTEAMSLPEKDAFSALFDGYSLTTTPSAAAVPASANSLIPVAKKKIRKLPRAIVKAGEYGPEYEKWRKEQELAEQQALAEALTPVEEKTTLTTTIASDNASNQAPAKSPRRRGGGPKEGGSKHKIRLELVERGVPKQLWFLIKWLVVEAEASEGDMLVLYEEGIKDSEPVEVWHLKLTAKKHRGSTHHLIGAANRIGRFFAVYLKQETALCRSPTMLLGPRVEIRTQIRGGKMDVKYLIDSENLSSWDWIGLYHSSKQQPNYADSVTWSYVDVSSNLISLDSPQLPGNYVICYFSGSKKWTPLASSGILTIKDVNQIECVGNFILGGKVVVRIDISSSPRHGNDWVGLYLADSFKKHQYLATAQAPSSLAEVEFKIPNTLPEGYQKGLCVRYCSTLAAPLSGGALISSSATFNVNAPTKV